MFILFRAEKLTDNLEFFQREFEKDLILASTKNQKGEYIIPAQAANKEESAGINDIEKFNANLKELRKIFAEKYEKYTEKLFEENKDKFNEKEIKNYIEKMKKIMTPKI